MTPIHKEVLKLIVVCSSHALRSWHVYVTFRLVLFLLGHLHFSLARRCERRRGIKGHRRLAHDATAVHEANATSVRPAEASALPSGELDRKPQ